MAPTSEQLEQRSQIHDQIINEGLKFNVFLGHLQSEFADKQLAHVKIETVKNSLALQHVIDQMPTGTVLVETIVSPTNYTAIVLSGKVKVARQPAVAVSADYLRNLVMLFREALEDPRVDPRPVSKELYDILIKPIEGDLEQADRAADAAKPGSVANIMWSLDGVLRYIPMEALYDGNRYVADKWCCSNIDIQMTTYLAAAPANSWSALGLGVSTGLAPDFDPLPGVKAELAGIIKDSTGNGILTGKTLLDEAFTRSAMENNLRSLRPQVVHIASHFSFDPAGGAVSFFAVRRRREVYHMTDLEACDDLFGDVDLLTLSACDTAMGDENSDGSEVEAFDVDAQQEGARSVVASLWPVADDSTPALMRQFLPCAPVESGNEQNPTPYHDKPSCRFYMVI